MKTLFALFSLLLSIAAASQAQQLGIDNPELKLPSGRVLAHTRVLHFDGEIFQIQNANGVSSIPWTSMPADWQAKFPLDHERARKLAEHRKEQLARMTISQTALEQSRPAATTPAPAVSQFGTVMELPRHNLETTLEDLKVGITQEKLLRILGNPLRVNGTQWIYRTGQVYVENGVVVALQNYYGDVFAAEWKRGSER
jgi:hypothetical protein